MPVCEPFDQGGQRPCQIRGRQGAETSHRGSLYAHRDRDDGQQDCLRLRTRAAAGGLPPDCEHEQQDTRAGECERYARWPDSFLLVPLVSTTCSSYEHPEEEAHHGAACG